MATNSVTLGLDPGAAETLAGYTIYYGSESGVYTNRMFVGNVTSATVSGLVAGTTYYFVATATDIEGAESDFSNEVSYSVPDQPMLALADALDAPGLTWTSGGDTPGWYPQVALTHDGADAAQSGAITDRQTNWVETVVTGPGMVSFWWKVSSEANYDFVRFFVNGVLEAQRSGEGDWEQASFAVGPGAQTLRWDYRKDASVSSGSDAAWLDQVSFVPSATTLTLAEALDTHGWSWTTGGDAPAWYPQLALTHDGADAAQSGAITDGQTNWIEAVVTGPGTVSFWWKVSSETNYDFVRFFVNGDLQARRSGEGDWEQASFAVGPGVQTLRWDYRKDESISSGSDTAWLDQVSFMPSATTLTLAEALDAPALTWTSGGDTPGWYPQLELTHDGADAAQSGAITDGQTNWVETVVTGPGTVSFWWKVSSEANYDFVRFFVNGVLEAQRSGEGDWEQASFGVAPGVQTLRWDYRKDASVSSGSDAAWLDQVSFVPSAATLTLAEALDTPGWSWTEGGDTPGWYPQVALTHDGADAAQSGAITDGQTNWIETVVSGPGTVSFWWKVSSEINYDFVRFFVNGELQARRSGEGDWEQASFAMGPGVQTLRWDYRKDESISSGSDTAWLDQVSFVPSATTLTLAEALDAPGLTWTSEGDMPGWYPQVALTHDGADAAQSGAIADGQTNWVETVVTGPGAIRFWWKVSSEANYDFVRFFVNGVPEAQRSGEGDWQQETFLVGAGVQTLRWEYGKDGSVSSGSDAAWLDQVSFAPEATAFTAQNVAARDSGASDVQVFMTIGLTKSGYARLQVRGPAGRICRILASDNLVEWTSVGTAAIGADGAAEFIEPGPTSAATRFYQVVLP